MTNVLDIFPTSRGELHEPGWIWVGSHPVPEYQKIDLFQQSQCIHFFDCIYRKGQVLKMGYNGIYEIVDGWTFDFWRPAEYQEDMKEYRVKLRRTDRLKVKPNAEQIDGKIFKFVELWPIEEGDTSLPIIGEYAMSPISSNYPKDAPSWIASGDLQEVTH